MIDPDTVSQMNEELSAELEPIAPDPAAPVRLDDVVVPLTARPPHWIFALLQAIAICGIPTQLLVFAVMVVVRGMPVTPDGNLDLGFFTTLEFIATASFIDTALIVILIRVFLMASRENSRDVYLGRRPAWGEIGRGLALVPVTLMVVVAVVSLVRSVAPWLHNVKVSPLEAFMRNPLDAAIFLVVVVLAGGIREELQRGFILHRFGQRLGGMWVGNLTYGLTFGLLHFDQGWDIAFAVGLLGLAWGAAFIRRRSVVMSMANHAGFNAAQVLQQVLATSLGIGK